MVRDRPLWLALSAGPLVWATLLAWQPAALSWRWPGISELLWTAAIYPVLEEIVFRGLLQGYLARLVPGRLLGPVSRANAATSLVFTGAHLLVLPGLWSALVFLPSLVFGYFRDRDQSINRAIGLHVFYNLGGLLFITSVP